jgi:cell division protein FtsQ
VPTVRRARREESTFVEFLDHALGRILRPLADLVPRRLRRAAEKLELQRRRPMGQLAAAGFLAITILYALFVGGQIGHFGDQLLVASGFGIKDVKINGGKETSEIAVLEQLDLAGSLIGFDVEDAQKRLAQLPWVERASVRKFYPGTLSIEIAEHKPFALWQRGGDVFVIDKTGTEIIPFDESRFAKLPLMVGGGANETAQSFLADLLSEPDIAGQMRAAVLVAGRRWDLHLDNGVTVKLPEKGAREALQRLVKLNSERQLLARDVSVVDLRLPDRVTVRLPEGRSVEDVTSESGAPAKPKART